MTSLTFEYLHKVQWADTDAAGITHFTAVFRYAEAAETAYFESLLRSEVTRLVEEGYALERVHVEADYRRPFRFGDVARVRICPVRLGRRSLEMHSVLDRSQDPEGSVPCATVGIVMALVDLKAGESVPWPENLAALLTAEIERRGPSQVVAPGSGPVRYGRLEGCPG